MNPSESPEISVQALLALRRETDAVRHITELLRVKEMGPSDHIRTKHEVKIFVESGSFATAEELVKRAHERRSVKQILTEKISVSQQRGQRID